MPKPRGLAFDCLLVLGLGCLVPGTFGVLAAADPLSVSPMAEHRVSVELAATESEPLDGRLLVLFSTTDTSEPRFQVRSARADSAQVFGMDVWGWSGASQLAFPNEAGSQPDSGKPGEAYGYPLMSLKTLPAGDYWVQAVFHRYQTFERADGHVVKLPMDRGEGQHWNLAPGNLYSKPLQVTVAPSEPLALSLRLDQVIEPVETPSDTRYIKHVRMKSKLLSDFWGRDMYLGAHVLVPEGFDEHLDARYPLMIFHGHSPSDFGGFRESPPDPDLECRYSARFDVDCYNRVEQEESYDFYKKWTSEEFPRFLIAEIQHANPYYDDSYAVNSENLGPYGDAITYELIPFLEKQFRGLGEGWARFLYGGSTGGWEALAAQVFYPTEYNGAFAACPDPIDFRAFMVTNIYEDKNAYAVEGPFGKVERPGRRNFLGHVSATVRDFAQMELALGSKNRSGDQLDIWEAVYSPVAEDGYPRRLWDKVTGELDPEVVEHWKKYDLGLILREQWGELGKDLAGKIHLYCGDMDNYYLNNAVYLVEDTLRTVRDPVFGGVVEYGDRAEHCWNGDHDNGNHISRLRYNSMYLPKIMKRIHESAPEGADLTSWKY